jgi:hypothetical protein
MSDSTEHTRRDFIAGAIALSGGLLLSGKGQNALATTPLCEEQRAAVEAMLLSEPQLVLFDAERSDACRNVSAAATATAAGQGCAVRAIEGDRVRFAREVLGAADAPPIVLGHTTYADFILITGSAAEHGYRVLSEQCASAGAQGALVTWKIGRLRGGATS